MNERVQHAAAAHDIAAVVVTHNRRALLADLIESLLAQSHPLAAIYVVDNASSDGTEADLRARAVAEPAIHYIRLETNTGGSGGFHAGVRAAHANGHGWFWLMDDDVRAFPDGLAGLVPHLDRSGCVHGRRRDFDGSPFFWQCRFSERLAMPLPRPGDLFRDGDEWETNCGVFEGMLVSRDVVERIGFPDARFFITWDDAIYGWLASACTRVLYVDHDTLQRRRRQRRINVGFRHFNDASDLFRFYTLRNRPLVRDYLQRAGRLSPAWFAVGTFVLVARETVRLLVVERRVRGFGALWRGWLAARSMAGQRLAVPALDVSPDVGAERPR